MTGRADSVAARSIRDAEGTLRTLELSDPRLAPPFELRLGSSERRRVLSRAAPAALEPAQPAQPAQPESYQAWRRLRGDDERARVASPPQLAKAPTLAEALAALAAGRTTTRELVEAALEVAASTVELGAVVAIDEAAVRDEADRLDAERAAGRVRGALHGIPITVKDVIDVHGLPTRAGSLAYDDPAPGDALAVALLREAGALLLAKVATHEFALGVATPQCRNPHDPTRISGGSSGGSAIAVATGVGLASLGTDTRASLRVPAHCCGVVGFKPTFGRVPAAGIVPLSWTIDHVGPIARTVEDAGALLDVLAGGPFLDLASAPAASCLAIGIVQEVFEDADPDVAAACEAALLAAERGGCRIVEVAGPSLADLELSNALGLVVSRSEAAAFHRSRRTDLDRCIPEVRDQLSAALTISAADYLDAQRQRNLLCARTVAHFSVCDVVASPTAPVVAPPRANYEQYLLRLSRNTIIWSLAGAPALSMPCGAGAGGLPVGLQLAAPPGAEQVLVVLGTALESALR